MEITISVPQEVEHILEQQAAASGQDVKALVENMIKTQALRSSLDESLPHSSDTADFESDMMTFAEGTENLSPYNGTYSRADLYFDHD